MLVLVSVGRAEGLQAVGEIHFVGAGAEMGGERRYGEEGLEEGMGWALVMGVGGLGLWMGTVVRWLFCERSFGYCCVGACCGRSIGG